jgi:hypothetical protein
VVAGARKRESQERGNSDIYRKGERKLLDESHYNRSDFKWRVVEDKLANQR